MIKNVLIGIAALGGLLVVSMILQDTAQAPENIEEESSPIIPAYFSGQFPIYQEGLVQRVSESEGENSKDVTLTISATASIKEVNQWYADAFGGGDWSIKSDKNVAGYRVIQAENGNLYTSMQAANAAESSKVNITQHLKIKK